MRNLISLFLLVAPMSSLAVDFSREVCPNLSDTCFKCHGPGETKGDLRLDDREDALDAGVLSPGEVAKSELVKRIRSTDPDEIMPPPEANKQLTLECAELAPALWARSSLRGGGRKTRRDRWGDHRPP